MAKTRTAATSSSGNKVVGFGDVNTLCTHSVMSPSRHVAK